MPRYDMVYVTKPLLNGSTVRTMKHQKNAPLAGDEEEGLGGGAEGTGPGDKPTTPGGRKKRRRLSTIGFFQGPTQEQIAAAQEADNEHTATTSPPNELAEKPEASKPVRRLSRIFKGRSKANTPKASEKANAVEPWGPETEGAENGVPAAEGAQDPGAGAATTSANDASNQKAAGAAPNGEDGEDGAAAAREALTPEQLFAADAEAKATDASSKAAAASAKRKELETAVAFENMAAKDAEKTKKPADKGASSSNNLKKEGEGEEAAVTTPRAATTTSGGPPPGSGTKF